MRDRTCFVTVVVLWLASAIAFASPTAIDISDAGGWQTPDWAGRPQVMALGSGGFSLKMANSSWMGVTRTVKVNLDETPVLAIRVASLGKGSGWVIKVDNKPYDPAKPCDITPDPAGGEKPGLYFVDLREIGGWRGEQEIEVRLFVIGRTEGQAIYSHVAFLPENTGQGSVKSGVSSGVWSLSWTQNAGGLTISRSGALGEVRVALPAGEEEVSGQTEEDDLSTVAIRRSANEWGKFETRLTAYKQPVGLFRWMVDCELTKPHVFAPGKPECSYSVTTAANRLLDGYGSGAEQVCVMTLPRVQQQGYESGIAFTPHDAALGASLLYFQNFTSLSDYFETTRVSLFQTVKSSMEAFGYAMPANPNVEFPAGAKVRLVDSFLLLDDKRLGGVRANDPTEVSRAFLTMMSTIYDRLPRPETVYTDWKDVADKMIADLMKPLCWCNFEKGYLRNYISEPWGPGGAELAVQIDPLVSTKRYERKWGIETPLVAKLAPTLPIFYKPDLKSIVDYSTDDEHSKLDSGWIVYMLIQLQRAAEMGVPEAGRIVENSIEHVISLAHKCGYLFPVFYNPNTMGSFEGSEPDTAGAYAYLMLQMHETTDEQRFLDEAIAALGHVAGYQMRYAYEMHATSLSAAACARMYKITADEKYLRLSYVPLASLIRHCWIWDCRFGFSKEHCTFFGVSCMPGAYIAALEQYRAWLGVMEYEALVRDQLPYEVRNLVSEFIKYGCTVLRYTMPPFMQAESIVQARPRGGWNDLSLYIPVEDLYDGSRQHGETGQEVYGTGGPMTVASEAFTLVPEAGISLFSEYPVRSAKWNAQEKSLSIDLAGVKTHDALVAIRYDSSKCGWKEPGELKITAVQGKAVRDRVESEGLVRFRAAGDGQVVVKGSGAR